MPRGIVKRFNDAKGYGFILGPDGQDVFVHYSSISNAGFRTLREGQVVDYEERQGPRGLLATSVSPVQPNPRSPPTATSTTAPSAVTAELAADRDR
jgi:CspA family cold shock protein